MVGQGAISALNRTGQFIDLPRSRNPLKLQGFFDVGCHNENPVILAKLGVNRGVTCDTLNSGAECHFGGFNFHHIGPGYKVKGYAAFGSGLDELSKLLGSHIVTFLGV